MAFDASRAVKREYRPTRRTVSATASSAVGGGIAPFRPSNSMPMTKNRCLENLEHRFCCIHNETALNQASLRCNNNLCTGKIPLQSILSFDFLASRKGLTYILRHSAHDGRVPNAHRTGLAISIGAGTRMARCMAHGAACSTVRRTTRYTARPTARDTALSPRHARALLSIC